MNTLRRLKLANRQLAARTAGFDRGLRELSRHLEGDKFRDWPYVNILDVERWIEWIRHHADATEYNASLCPRCQFQPAGDNRGLRCDDCREAANTGKRVAA